MRRARCAAASLLAVAGLSAGLQAQRPADRHQLERLRDSLAATTDSAALTAAARLSMVSSDSEAQALGQLRRGFFELRLAELGNTRRYRRAESAFNASARLEPSWPYPPFGRALAKYGISQALEAEPLELGTQVGMGALDDAVTALTAALAADPSFAPALGAMGRFAQRFRRPDFWQRSLMAARRADSTARRRPEVLLALGRLEREAGSPDSAAAAFAAYLAAGGNRGLGLLELARTRLAAGGPGGDSAYYAGAADDDTLAVRGYRNDIAVMLANDELAAFDTTRGAERAAWLRNFWTDRDRLDLRSPGERLPEHYRRLAYARRNFGLTVTRRYYPIGCIYRSGSMDFDDRGIIYIRQGEPTVRLKTYLFQIMPNESWRYARADGDLLFHFGAPSAVDDYRLFSSVLELFGACRPETRQLDASQAVTVSDMYLSRQTLSPMYARLSAWAGTIAGAELAREEARIGAASIAVGTRTDAYERGFARALPAAISLAAVGREGSRTLVHVIYGLGGEGLTGMLQNGSWRYPVRLRFVAFDSAGRVVASADTAVILTTDAAVPARAMLFGRFALPVPPGRWRYRLSLQQGDSSGVVTPRDTLSVGRYDGPLSMSDPVLGWRPIALNWARGADTVFFSPFHRYFGATELELYYEVYGMPSGAAYQTDVLVAEKKGTRAGPAGVRLRFGGVAGEGVTSGRRTLDLRQFKPGAYWLDLVVTDATGHQVRRRTWFEVKPAAKAPGQAITPLADPAAPRPPSR